MNNAKMLTLEEIKNLPKASVIWRQEFYLDSDYDIEYSGLCPANPRDRSKQDGAE